MGYFLQHKHAVISLVIGEDQLIDNKHHIHYITICLHLEM